MDMHGISQAFKALNDRNKNLVSGVVGVGPVVSDVVTAATSNVNWVEILKVVSNIGQFIPGVGQYIPLVTKVIAVVEEIQVPGHDKKQVALDIIKTALSVYNTVGRANIDVEAVSKTLSPIIDLIITITNTIHRAQ